MLKSSWLQLMLQGVVALAGVWQFPAQALDPTKPPGGNFDLTNFYLGLPVDGSGGTSGNSASVSAALLTSGYSNALYFYTGPDGAMTFWAPVTGATTSGSSYPRSELREQISPPLNSSNWQPHGIHVLSGQCRVIQVPSSGKVIIGQIHGYTGDARPLLKLQFNNGVVEALVKTNSNFDPDYKFHFQNVGLNNLITYEIRQENGWLTTSVNGSNQTINVFATDPDWATNRLYFKAGSYCQDNVGPTNEGARIAFYSLSRSHSPSITNQPSHQTAMQGGGTTLHVSATGNGSLKYQWWFNQTNVLAGATNASLAFTNVSTADAGDYAVVVRDNLGSITSAVATLSVVLPPGITVQPTNQLAQIGDNAALGVTATGTEPLSYHWYFNTNQSLVNATNETLILSNVSSANAGAYTVAITNIAGAITSSPALLLVNHPPAAGSIAGVTGQDIALATPLSTITAAAFDQEGDAILLTSVASNSVNGGNLWITNSAVWYAPATGFSGSDQWSYVLADTRGGSITATAAVTVIADNAILLEPTGQSVSGEGFFRATFQGVPGLLYSVDRATNLAGPWEIGVTNIRAEPAGCLEVMDEFEPSQAQKFYRIRYP